MKMPARSLLAALMLAFALPALTPGRAGAQETPLTLYGRLGGYDFLARFVDTAFPRVAREPRLARLFQGHSADSQMRQRQLIVDALCHATGGPCIYIGRDLTTVHRGLGIKDADWSAFMSVIAAALDELAVPATERRDFVRMFEMRLRPTVVVDRPGGGP